MEQSYKNDINDIYSLDLPWEKLSGANILITGATGLIGSCLLEVLMSNPHIDYHVYASGRNKERAISRFGVFSDSPYFHFLRYDVMEEINSDIDFHYIIHAASNASPNFFVSNPVEIIKANILGVDNLMKYGISHGLRRFLFVSSGEVYGEGDGRVFTEEYSGYVDCVIPRSCYPSSKRAAETLCVAYGEEYAVDSVIVRPCHVYGPNFTESDNRAYAQFLRDAVAGRDIIMKSSGEQYRSWCYVVDAVLGILYVLLKGERGNAYNIADENSNVTIREFAEMIAHACGREVIFEVPTETEAKGFNKVRKSVFSTAKLSRLGWKTEGTINDKIKRTINSLIEN